MHKLRLILRRIIQNVHVCFVNNTVTSIAQLGDVRIASISLFSFVWSAYHFRRILLFGQNWATLVYNTWSLLAFGLQLWLNILVNIVLEEVISKVLDKLLGAFVGLGRDLNLLFRIKFVFGICEKCLLNKLILISLDLRIILATLYLINRYDGDNSGGLGIWRVYVDQKNRVNNFCFSLSILLLTDSALLLVSLKNGLWSWKLQTKFFGSLLKLKKGKVWFSLTSLMVTSFDRTLWINFSLTAWGITLYFFLDFPYSLLSNSLSLSESERSYSGLPLFICKGEICR